MGTLGASQLPQPVTPMGQVSGQVIEDGTNALVAGARVFVILEERFAPADPPPASVTDEDGRYHFDALPAGRYRIAAQKTGFAPPMEPSTMAMFELSAGQVLDGLTVSLQRGGVITGRVLDQFGKPLVDVGVTALLKRLHLNDRPAGLSSSGAPLLMPSGQDQTNDLGEFRILGLPPGEYVIAASPRSDFTFFPGTPDVSAAQPVSVLSGETVSALTIQLVAVPAFRVSGVVVDGVGAPVAGVTVMLMTAPRGTDFLVSLAMGAPRMSQSDASGAFTFGDVAAGSYTLRAAGFGGIFAATDNFGIDIDGTPRADPIRPTPALEPGTLDVTIDTANVSDLRIVVAGAP